jgi:hypothetical protein
VGNQILKNFASRWRCHVESDAALVAVQGLEKQAAVAFLERRDIPTNITVGTHIFNFDDIGAQVSKVHAAKRPSPILFDSDDA